MTDWPSAPLSDSDLAKVRAVRWRVRPVEEVIRVAEAWNAGMTTAQMAVDLRCPPASLRLTIGKLVQIGVTMRRAMGEPAPSMVTRSPLAEQMADEQFRRLSRLAEFDPAAKRALSLYRRGLTA